MIAWFLFQLAQEFRHALLHEWPARAASSLSKQIISQSRLPL